MKIYYALFFIILGAITTTAQNVGINQSNPTNSLHITPLNNNDPLRIDGLNPYAIGDSSILIINSNTGVVKYIHRSEFVNLINNGNGLGTDNQNIDSLVLNGYTLSTYIENGSSASVDLSPLSDSITNNIITNQNFTTYITSVLYDQADTLLYNTNFINSLRDSIDTDVDSVVLNGNTLSIYENNVVASVDLSALSDADSDPTNEIQDLQLNGNNLSITNNGSATIIDLSAYLDNTDDQNLTGATLLAGNILQIDIENGNSITVNLNSLLNDADADPTNEIQDLQLNGNNLSITNNSNATIIDLTTYRDNTDNQNLSQTSSGSNVTINITNGNSTTFSVNDGDFDPTNEYNTSANLSGTNLNIIDGGGTKTVDLSSLVDHDWYKVGTTSPATTINDNLYTQGNIGIGLTTPTAPLEITSTNVFLLKLNNSANTITNNAYQNIIGFFDGNGVRMGYLGDGSPTSKNMQVVGNEDYGIKIQSVSGINQYRAEIYLNNNLDTSITFRTKNLTRILVEPNGDVGIGTITPTSKLQIVDYYDTTMLLTPFTSQNAKLPGISIYHSSDFIGLTTVDKDNDANTGNDADGMLYWGDDGGAEDLRFTRMIWNGTRLIPNDRMIIKGSGEVGIGTNTPTDKLHVDGNIRVGIITNGTIQPAGYGNGIVFSGGPDVSSTFDSDNSDPLSIFRYNVASDKTEMRIRVGDNSQADDALSIGYTYNTWTERFRLDMTGIASKPGGGTWATISDRRTKKEINAFSDGLNVLTKIKPVTFKYNGLYNTTDDNQSYVGIIAQEVKDVAPYMIGTYKATKTKDANANEEELLNYDGGTYMLYVLVNSVKEQQKQIEELQKTNELLLKEIELLKKK